MTSINGSVQMNVADTIFEEKLFAIIRGVSTTQIVETVHALVQGGVKLLEVTFCHDRPEGIEDTLFSLNKIQEVFSGQVCLGAGTVLTAEQVRLAEQAGAQFIVSPNVDSEVIRTTKKLNLFSLPGALTPTEIVSARRAGADMVKLFPVGNFGPGYVKDLRGPLSDIPLIAVGGINQENIVQFLAAGAVGVGVGGSLVSLKNVNEGNFAAIEQRAKDLLRIIRNEAS